MVAEAGEATCQLKSDWSIVRIYLRFLRLIGPYDGQANVLLAEGTDGELVAKLCDFGSAVMADVKPDEQGIGTNNS